MPDRPHFRAVTIQDIADEVGVSKMTVSAVLSDKAHRLRISVSTQERVHAAAQRLGYRPNEVARSLARQSTNTIGFYVGHTDIDPTDPWMAVLIGGLQGGCTAQGNDLLLHSRAYGKAVDEVYASLVDRRIDGLIYYGPAAGRLVELIRESALPTVAIVDAVPGLPSVVPDDRSGARLIAEHLIAGGHRRAAYIAQQMDATSVHVREQAFFDAAEAGGLRVDRYPVVTHGQEARILEDWRGMPASARWSALVTWDDLTAYRIWVACQKAQVQIPNEIALVGYDGIEAQMDRILSLTTIRVPWMRLAATGVEQLMALRRGEDVPELSVIPVSLQIGNTA